MLKSPGPQHPVRRLNFFIDHPEFTNAKSEIQKLRKMVVKRVKKQNKKQKPSPSSAPATIAPTVKQSFFQRIFSPRRTP